LLVYCTTRRAEAGDSLWVAMPIAMLTIDSNRVLMSLYEQELVETDPEVLADMLGLPGSWVDRAKASRP
jgi:hypothetical protein